MTSGSSFEALNNIVHLHPQKLIVVLNDNGMSISENIGFLTNWRKRFDHPPRIPSDGRAREGPFAESAHGRADIPARQEVQYRAGRSHCANDVLGRDGIPIPGPRGRPRLQAVGRDASASKNVLRLSAFGPRGDHKGHGYEPAEDDPVKFHQPSSPLGDGSGAPTYSKVFAQTLTRLMHEDDSVVGISAAMLEGTGLVEARKDFPDRVFDVGIAEQNAVSMAAGMASKGLKPFVSIYSTFLQRAFDQVVHDVCIQNLPVDADCRSRRYRRRGRQDPPRRFRHLIPAVSTQHRRCGAHGRERTAASCYTAYKHRGPFFIRIARGAGTGATLDGSLKELPLGRGSVIREGRDVVIFGLGKSASAAAGAAERLPSMALHAAL